ncbi:MAG: hypothetical protein KBS38_00090 [Bacteroidales bacterium]|nr:hypothetical protein [Candidatus Cacconaster caballi]
MNLRVIKKDIEFLVGDFIEDCLLFAMFHEEVPTEKVEVLMNEANDLADDIFDKVNHPAKDVKLKAYYSQIMKDLYKGLDDLCAKLSALAKSGKGKKNAE